MLAIALFERVAGPGIGGQLQPRHEMRQIEQILQHDLRIGATLIERFHLLERAGGVAPQHRLQQLPYQPAIGDTEHVAHRRRVDRAAGGGITRKGDRLIEQRQTVAHGAIGGACDQTERLGRGRDMFGVGDPAIMLDELLDRHAPQREALAARQNGQRHLADLGRREDEFDVGRRLFERLQ